jgi:hypothetical protein
LLLLIGWVWLKGSNPFSPTIPSYTLTKLVADKDEDPR